MTTFSSSSSSSAAPAPPQMKKYWWITNKKIAEKNLVRARSLLETQDSSEIQSAISLLDAALELCPRWDRALELKARALLFLKKFREIATMLQEYIPSLRFRDIFTSDSPPVSREKVKLLPSSYEEEKEKWPRTVLVNCFSVEKLKERLSFGLSKNCEREEWRFLILGQACCHLGMLEDALVLLQSGKRAASAAFRKESTGQHDDDFHYDSSLLQNPPMESEVISHWLCTIKFLLRRKAAAMAALDAGLYTEAARLFSKILDGRRGTPQGFIAECYMLRAIAYQAAGRVADAIADCNRALALDPTCIEALTTRASLFETVRCLSESLQDLEHAKLLYESILRHQKFPGPAWKLQNVSYRNVNRNLETLNSKILAMKQRLSSPSSIDYYKLIGLMRGCSRADVERAHLLLCLRHRPDKSSHFVERCEFVDERDIDSVKEQARLSAMMLYRLLQKAYTFIMTSIMEEEAEKQKQLQTTQVMKEENEKSRKSGSGLKSKAAAAIRVEPKQQQQQTQKENDNHFFSLIDAEPDKRDFDGEYQQVLLAVSSKTAWPTRPTSAAATRSTAPSRPPRMRDNFKDYDICSAKVKDGSRIQDMSDASSSYQNVSCRDMAAVRTLLSQGFPAADSWMNSHQGHPLRTLPVSYEALSCS